MVRATRGIVVSLHPETSDMTRRDYLVMFAAALIVLLSAAGGSLLP
jgi:hypothetical protein